MSWFFGDPPLGGVPKSDVIHTSVSATQTTLSALQVGTQENKYKKKNTASPVEEVDDAEDSHDEDEHEHEHAEIEEHEQAEHEKYDHEKYDHKATQKGHNHWDQIVSKRLGTEWGVVKSSVLWQMRLTVFAPLRHLAGDLARISHVEMRKSRTGIGGVVANKGGLVCRLDFAGTTLCFISSHLAAHSHKLKQRNDNCQEILRETARLAHNHLDAASHFDHVFWLGDLNYRVDLNAKAKEAGRPEKSFDAQMDEVQACINRGDFATLWEWDQLKMAQADGTVCRRALRVTVISSCAPPLFECRETVAVAILKLTTASLRVRL